MVTEQDMDKGLGRLVKVYLKGNRAFIGVLGYSFDDLDDPTVHYYKVSNVDWISVSFHARDVECLEIYNIQEIIRGE